jgi:hypothetical protein
MKAICRVSKVKGAGSISGKSAHNYRLAEVPNADPNRQHLNEEYVNIHKHLGPAIDGRIQDAGITKTRQDAVKGMEFILTASPERFKRDEAGQAVGDYRQHPWVKANLDFMQQKYGDNLVAFTLHQDEKTPHIHAVVVPITDDGRLCAKEMFNPKSLRDLQTEYAQAMKPFGLERGIEGSRARHVEMKQIYGMQQQERLSIQQELAPLQQPQQPLQIEQPGMLDLLNLERWKQQQEAQINAEYNRRLAELRKLAEKAQNMAVANATAKEQGKVLQQRLETSEKLKQANYEVAQANGAAAKQASQAIDKIAVMVSENRLNPEWLQQRVETVQNRVMPQLEKDVAQSVQAIKATDGQQASKQLIENLESKGYQIGQSPDGRRNLVIEPNSGLELNLSTHSFNGRSFRELVDERINQLQQKSERQDRGLSM